MPLLDDEPRVLLEDDLVPLDVLELRDRLGVYLLLLRVLLGVYLLFLRVEDPLLVEELPLELFLLMVFEFPRIVLFPLLLGVTTLPFLLIVLEFPRILELLLLFEFTYLDLVITEFDLLLIFVYPRLP